MNDEPKGKNVATEFVSMPAPGDRCANYVCTNRVGEGAWVLVHIPTLTVSPTAMLKPLHLSMCGPCATRLSHEIASEREGS